MKKKLLFIVLAGTLAASAWLYWDMTRYHMRELIEHETETLQLEEISLDWKENDDLITDQNMRQSVIDQMFNETETSFASPLFIYNAYGNNRMGVNIYFRLEDKYPTTLRYSITADGNSYGGQLIAPEVDNVHAYQLTGLIPGKTNEITLELSNEYQTLETKTWTLEMPVIEDLEVQLIKDAEENSELSDGLFVMLGRSLAGNTFMYDNEGTIRGEIRSDLAYRADQLIIHEGMMYYSYGVDRIAAMNPLGKIEKIYNLWQYGMHHDYCISNDGTHLLVLASDRNTEMIEDLLIQVNLETFEVSELIDFKDLLPDTYSYAKQHAVKNSYGTDALDWIHINSFQLFEDNSILISSRELSAIIKISDIYNNPKAEYALGADFIINEYTDEITLLNKEGDFNDVYGQHSLQTLPVENGYELIVFDNAWASSTAFPLLEWEKSEACLDFANAEAHSYLVRYFVNETEGTYELLQRIPVSYSSIVSSAQFYQNHLIASPGYNTLIGSGLYEFDNEGQLLAHFTHEKKDITHYRIYKFNFEGFWFTTNY